jgi:hypothetical protein
MSHLPNANRHCASLDNAQAAGLLLSSR